MAAFSGPFFPTRFGRQVLFLLYPKCVRYCGIVALEKIKLYITLPLSLGVHILVTGNLSNKGGVSLSGFTEDKRTKTLNF